MMRRIAFIFAMQAEAAPIIASLKAVPVADEFSFGLPMKAYHSDYERGSVLIVTSGIDPRYKVDCIGSQPASLATFLTIKHFAPDLVISAGTAGGFCSKGAQIGDLILSSMIQFHDRQLPLASFTDYGLGYYRPAQISGLTGILNAKLGAVSSGDSVIIGPTDLDKMLRDDVLAKDMEAAAVAWVASCLLTPVIALKVITDFVDKANTGVKDFVNNFDPAIMKLTEAIAKLIEYTLCTLPAGRL